MTFTQVIELLRLTAPIRQAICTALRLDFLAEPQDIVGHPKSPSDHSPGRVIDPIRGAGNTYRPGGLLYRTGIKKQRKVENANAPAGAGYFVETSPGEQVMATESAATDGGSLAARAVGEDVAANANDHGE